MGLDFGGGNSPIMGPLLPAIQAWLSGHRSCESCFIIEGSHVCLLPPPLCQHSGWPPITDDLLFAFYIFRPQSNARIQKVETSQRYRVWKVRPPTLNPPRITVINSLVCCSPNLYPHTNIFLFLFKNQSVMCTVYLTTCFSFHQNTLDIFP